MTRPITLFTGQWADLPLEEVARLAADWGYDGLEIACWGDHLDPWRWDDDDYVQGKLDLLERHGLKVWAISNHLKGQAVCDDPIDQRHRDILRDRVWGDGDPEGVRQRAAEEMKNTARLAAKLGVKTVVGFTGSSIWKYVAMFPPVSQAMVDAGYQDFADRWNPILDVFDEVGVRFAHEVHPSEIAYDYWTTVRTLEAIGHRAGVRPQLGPVALHVAGARPGRLHPGVQGPDLPRRLQGREAEPRQRPQRPARLAPRRGPTCAAGWDFVSTGRGDVPWEASFRALNSIGYDGPISVEWEDAGMDRLLGAPEALEFVQAQRLRGARGGLRRRLQLALSRSARQRGRICIRPRCRLTDQSDVQGLPLTVNSHGSVGARPSRVTADQGRMLSTSIETPAPACERSPPTAFVICWSSRQVNPRRPRSASAR